MDDGFLSPNKLRRVEASPRKGTTELSPRRVPRSPLRPPATPPNWKRPHEVMRLHKLKRGSLVTRFSRPEVGAQADQLSQSSQSAVNNSPGKRKNPFRVDTCRGSPKRWKQETCGDSSSMLRLLGLSDTQAQTSRGALDLQTIIDRIKLQNQPQEVDAGGRRSLAVDWSLRSKVRFMSTKPFPWNQTLKTCEEASGITGFVRCLSEREESLDTSPNAVFHKRCLYWQYPWFPWLCLYPRGTSDTRKQQVDKNLPSFASHPHVKETLHSDFTDSFTSVFQLLRARHCPYFYVVSNMFSCLFRAAGIAASPEISAMVCPTTPGFRQLLRDNDVEFKLPLKQEKKRRSGECDGVNSSKLAEDHQEADDQADEDDQDDETETRKWLSDLGLPTNHLDKLSSSSGDISTISEVEVDVSDESLVYIEGSDVSSLFNLLINLRSCTASTGPAAGVPPTILSPVAFTGATLASLRVRESLVKAEKESFHSMEMCGPILPDTVHYLCDMLRSYLDQFSVTFATDVRTKPFSVAASVRAKGGASEVGEKVAGPAFSVENLSDCGIDSSLLPTFCSNDISPFDSIKFSDGLYTLV